MNHVRRRHQLALWSWCIAFAIAFALAMTGFPSYLATPDQDLFAPRVLLDSVYRSLQLFVLSWEWSSRWSSRPIPWTLQVARLLAAGVALSAVLAALFQLFRERVASFLLQLSRDHVILCGLGERGVALVENLAESRRLRKNLGEGSRAALRVRA